MDALHPRLLAGDYRTVYAFYDAVLPKICGAVRAAGGPDAPYASWDVDGQGILSLFDRAAIAAVVGTFGLASTPPPAQDVVMFVCRVDNVDDALDVCVRHGAGVAAPPADRPEWGPNLRTAHFRDPQGTLIELQSY